MASKGERIWSLLQNPASKDIGASEWLLLYTIHKNGELCTQDIGQKLAENWKRVHAENPSFYIVWSTGYEINKELIRYEDLGMVRISNWRGDSQCWSLTPKGYETLKVWKPRLKDVLRSVAEAL